MTEYPSDIRTFLFIPLFNVKVSEDILNKKINGFQIITSKQYFESYRHILVEKGWPEYTNELDYLVEIPKLGAIYHPVSSYIVVKEILLPERPENVSFQDLQVHISKCMEKILYFLMACRLVSGGNIQIKDYFVISKILKYRGNLGISTNGEDIDGIYLLSKHQVFCIPHYDITSINIKKILLTAKKLFKVYDVVKIPIQYFMQYYSAKDIYDKIIKLAIVWETSILNDCKDELKYRLQVRSSSLLHRDISKVLALVYDIRSDIVHGGDVKKNEIKKLKKIVGNDNIEETFVLIFIFIRDYLENITREILCIFINKIYKTRKTIEQVAKEIDDSIFCSFEKINPDTKRD